MPKKSFNAILFLFRNPGDPLQSPPVMSAFYLLGVSQDDLVRLNFILGLPKMLTLRMLAIQYIKFIGIKEFRVMNFDLSSKLCTTARLVEI